METEVVSVISSGLTTPSHGCQLLIPPLNSGNRQAVSVTPHSKEPAVLWSFSLSLREHPAYWKTCMRLSDGKKRRGNSLGLSMDRALLLSEIAGNTGLRTHQVPVCRYRGLVSNKETYIRSEGYCQHGKFACTVSSPSAGSCHASL